MIIDYKSLIDLPVYTQRGLALGKIKNFEIDSETHIILRYLVKSRNLISKLLVEKKQELIIHRNHVISIDAEKMIVEDNVIKESEVIKLLRRTNREAPALSSRLNFSKNDG